MIKLTAFILVLSANSITMAADWNAAVSQSNPLNWYRLDETTGKVAIDYGSQGLNGTYGGGAGVPSLGSSGLVGGAVEFDGSSQNILFNGSAMNSNWTAEFILKKTGTKFSSELIRGAPFESPSSHLKLEQNPNTGQVGFTESFIADRVFSPAVTVPIGKFVHLVIVKEGGTTKAYLDGVLAGTSPSTVSLYRYQFGDTLSEAPIAVVDEIVIYNCALTPGEIVAHNVAIPEPWRLCYSISGRSV